MRIQRIKHIGIYQFYNINKNYYFFHKENTLNFRMFILVVLNQLNIKLLRYFRVTPAFFFLLISIIYRYVKITLILSFNSILNDFSFQFIFTMDFGD